MPRSARLPVVAALALAACATPDQVGRQLAGDPLAMRAPVPVAAEVTAAPFERQGEIQLTPVGTAGSSAAWDARSVRGPAVNLTLTDQELWGGTLQDRAVLLRARDGRITGEGVNLFVRQEGTHVRVQGLWFGALLRVDFTPETISASPLTGVCGLELGLANDGFYRGFGGCGGRLDAVWMTLKGVAADPSREMPQWLFAFLAALPAPQVSTFRGTVVAAAPSAAGGGVSAYLAPEFRGLPPVNWAQIQFSCSTTGGLPSCDPWGYFASGKAVTIDSFSTLSQDRSATGRGGTRIGRVPGGMEGGRPDGPGGRYANAGPVGRAAAYGGDRTTPPGAAER
ncbi:MAG: hypothetical protein WB493_05155, partial [Anaeromyxobacteraceae bacterium]